MISTFGGGPLCDELTASASGGLAWVLLSYGLRDGDEAKFGQYGLAEHGASDGLATAEQAAGQYNRETIQGAERALNCGQSMSLCSEGARPTGMSRTNASEAS